MNDNLNELPNDVLYTDNIMFTELLLDDDILLTPADFDQLVSDPPPSTTPLPAPPAMEPQITQLAKGDKAERRKHQVAKAVKNYRNRRKQELEYLRHRVSELQTKLDDLKETEGSSSLGKRRSGENWEEKAQGELKKRKQAEEENGILRREIQSQMYFAQTLQKFFVESNESAFFPNASHLDMNTLRLGRDGEQRRQMILDACEKDLGNVMERMKQAGLAMEQMTELPITKTDVRDINGSKQIEISKASLYVGFSAEQVAKAITKIFWAEVELPNVPAGGGVEFQELDKLDDDTSYSRFVCTMGTADMKLPGLEKLVIRKKRMEFGSIPTISWRTVLEDDLHPIQQNPRIDESGCLTVENGMWNNQRGAIVRMVIHVRPPFNAINCPPGTVVESYMSGFVDYMSQVEQLLGFMLIAASLF